MLFQSLPFLLVFLPLSLLAYYLVRDTLHAKWVLIAASLTFYGYWDRRLLPLLLVAVIVTWLTTWFALLRGQRQWLLVGVAGNLLLLAVFKYFNFFAENLDGLLGTRIGHHSILLPLAISFFTFHQISYLIDVWRDQAKLYRIDDYLLYIVFFPHLIAGPIVRHNEFMPQIEAGRAGVTLEQCGRGLALFAVGLAKKLWIADPLSLVSDGLFAKALVAPLSFDEAVACALAFSLQIYFDFSGYTDMAIGLARLFGYELPNNFNAPYRATSLIEFWRRWHITLSRYLRDYLYFALGGNKFGWRWQAVALLTTMTLGGLWHGAAWTFVIWGAIHGSALVVNHQIRRLGFQVPWLLGWLATFCVVAGCFVIFRATSLGHALHVLAPIASPRTFTGNALSLLEWAGLGLAFLLATAGPTGHSLVDQRLKPSSPVAIAIGVSLFALIMTVLRGGEYAPFLYFQF